MNSYKAYDDSSASAWESCTDTNDTNTYNATTFRLAAKKIFLTYHNFPDKLSDLLNFLKNLLSEQHVSDYAIAFHKNPHGAKSHAHVYLELTKKVDTRNCKYFDYENYTTKVSCKSSVLRIKDRYRNFTSIIHRNAGLATDPIEYVLKEITPNSIIDVDYLVSKNIYMRLGTRGNMLSPDAAAVRSAEQQNVSEAMAILYNEDAAYHSVSYLPIKKNLLAIANNAKVETYDTRGLVLNEYLYTKIDTLLHMVSAERSGTLVMIGKSLLSKTGLFMHYIATAYPDLGPAFRISSFEDLESIPLNCKILIIDNVSLKNQQVLERVKPLLRIVCKTTLRCNGEIGYLSPPVGTILLASNKSAIRSLNSTLKALDVAPVYVLNEHFEPVVTTED